MCHGNFDRQQAIGKALQRRKASAAVGRGNMPAIELVAIDGRDDGRHPAGIGGHRAATAMFAGRAHCLVDGIEVSAGPEHAHSGLEHVRV